MSFEEFKNAILNKIDNRPNWSRKGQFVFNYIEEHYGNVARDVQFIDKVDCFYNDSEIEEFIFKCYIRLKNSNLI